MPIVTVPTAAGEMALYQAEPEHGPRGAVVVLQEAFGVDDHIHSVADRLAAAGYRAVVPALFHRTGSPVLGHEDLDSVRPHMQALTVDGLLEDLGATLAHLDEGGLGRRSIGVVGFCMGGSIAVLAAAGFELGAAVTFYGGGVHEGRFGMPPLVELARDLRTPWLGLFGDRDAGIPVDAVEALRQAAATAPVPTEVVRYPDAGHAFNNDTRPDRYHRESATDAWGRALAWFAAHLEARAAA